MAAGLKTVISLSFVLALGFLLIILSCALYANWLPLLVALTFVVAPIPNAIFSRCAGGDDDFGGGREDVSNGFTDLGQFLTSTIVITGFAFPITMAHASVISSGACSMSIVGGLLVYGTIIAYGSFFSQEGEDY